MGTFTVFWGLFFWGFQNFGPGGYFFSVLLVEVLGPSRGFVSRTNNQPKEEVFGTDIPRTSGGHSRGCPGPKLRSGRSKTWKNKHFGVDIHDPKPRTSMTPRGFQKLRSEKLWAEFSFPIVAGRGVLKV